MSRVSRGLDRIRVDFDDPNLIANAGLLLVGTLVARLGLADVVNATVHMAGRIGGATPGRKVASLVHSIVAGGSHIDHADLLRSGNTAAVLPHRVMAPSTLGTFLRAFSFGHVRQLEAVVGRVLERARSLGAGPGLARLVIQDPPGLGGGAGAWNRRPLAPLSCSRRALSSGSASHAGTASKARNRSKTPVAFSMNTGLNPRADQEATNASTHSASNDAASKVVAAGVDPP